VFVRRAGTDEVHPLVDLPPTTDHHSGFPDALCSRHLASTYENKRLKLKKHFYFSIFGTNLSCSFKKKPKSSHIFEHLRNTTEPVVHLSGPIHTQLGCLIDRKAEMEIAR
jgi:hypothetical protein